MLTIDKPILAPSAPEGGHTIDVLRIIDELEVLVQEGKHVLGKVVINEEEFYIQVTKLKKALPKSLDEAQKITREAERILSGAKNEANRLMSDAQSESKRLIDDARSEAERARGDARSHADRIVEDARREAERIVADAQQHAEQLVAEDTIMQRAQDAAIALHEQAQHDAQAMRDHADQYAFEVLDRTSAVLNKLVVGVEAGKDHLRQIQQQ
jgi:cell division septum initiation protein DivIVA